jgi:hypothetical protein
LAEDIHTELVHIDVILGLKEDPPRVAIIMDCELEGLPSILASVGTDEWRQQVLDSVRAGLAGTELGLHQTMRQFEIRVGKEDGDNTA